MILTIGRVCVNVCFKVKKRHKVQIPHWKGIDPFYGFLLYPTSLASWACVVWSGSLTHKEPKPILGNPVFEMNYTKPEVGHWFPYCRSIIPKEGWSTFKDSTLITPQPNNPLSCLFRCVLGSVTFELVSSF